MKLKNSGFTLVELVVVIIILAIISIATTSYISTGVTLYSDISERDRELNSLRFTMERLRRDLLSALPNSLVVKNIGSTENQCLTFTPIKASTVYDYDFPISPLSAFTGTIASIEDYSFSVGDKAVVYLLDALDLNSAKVQPISAVDGETITFTGEVSFPLSSPSKRLYIIAQSKSYYFNVANELILADECGFTGAIMANDISGSFKVADATLQRNGLAKVTFNLDFDGQEVPIEQTLHINNAP